MTHLLHSLTICTAAVLSALSASGQGPGLPNLPYPGKSPMDLLSAIDNSVSAPRGHGFVTMHRGYLLVPFANDGGGGGGSGGFTLLDISDPENPTPAFTTEGTAPYNDNGSAQFAGRLAEPHGSGFAGDVWCHAAQGGGTSGIQFWDLSNPTAPNRLSELNLSTLTGGSYSAMVWWTFWQGGRYVYTASTTGGLHIVDASDPANPVELNRIPIGSLGGFRVNTCFAVGNLLVLGESDGGHIATYDIGDPANPVLLDVDDSSQVIYSMMVNGDRILAAHDPARVFDISDPANITLEGVGPNVAGKGGYGAFQDGDFFFGSSTSMLRLDLDSLPYTLIDSAAPAGFSNPDWDFATPLGNLVFVGNDHSGSALLVADTSPDLTGPEVNMVNPADGTVNAPVTSRVGITLTDLVRTDSIDNASFIVRPVGGSPLPGRYSNQTGIVNFWPDAPLQPNTTYEVVVTAGGIEDLAGNSLGTTFTSQFSTGATVTIISVDATSPGPSETNTLVNFTAIPGGAPSNPEYSWDFGDGTPVTAFSSSPNATHTYTIAGNYTVIVTLRDGSSTTTASFGHLAHLPITPTAPTASASIIYDGANNRVWNVNPDNDTVSALNATTFTKELEIPVGTDPQSAALGPANELWVTNFDSDTITRINRASGALLGTITLDYGDGPSGLAFAPDGSAAYVTLRGAGKLLRLDPSTQTVTGSVDLGRTPRAIAISADGSRILVTRFLSPDSRGEVLDIDAGTLTLTGTIALGIDPGPDAEDTGRGLPNYLTGIAISPDGLSAWVPSKKDNIQRGLARDGLPLTFETTVRSIASKIDLVSGSEELAARSDFNDRAPASAVAFSQLGNYAFVATRGTNTVEIVDTYSGEHFGSVLTDGRAPRGLAVSDDGSTLFVHNYMSRTVTAFAIQDLCAGTCGITPKLADVSVVATEALAPDVLTGKQVFYNAADLRMSRDTYISCAACHLDGDGDRRTWDFTDRGEGLRNTPSLQGRRGTGHGRLHWSANFDEIQDFEHDIRGPFDGTGFMSDTDFHSGNRERSLGGSKAGFSSELDDLAAYLTSLSATPRSPHRLAAGGMTASAIAGEALFQSRCATCHGGSDFTDSTYGALHDVGTLTGDSGNRLGLTLPGLDTPGLRGVWATAPYLHDGSAPDLMAVLTTHNPGDQHGVTSDLNPSELQNLVDYLLQLDDSSASFAAVPPNIDPNPDGDNIPTTYEETNGLDPYADDAGADPDGDGLDNGGEFTEGTDVNNPDSDGDGLTDGDEVDGGTDPLDANDPPITGFTAYHDFGETAPLPGNITVHTIGPVGSTSSLNTSPVELLRYSDGSPTGITITVGGANGTDLRNGVLDAPASGDPADALFNGVGLGFGTGLVFEGGNNGSGATTFTLSGLDPGALYDIAFVGGRLTSADGTERFTLSGADGTPNNTSSTGSIDAFTTDQETRSNPVPGEVIRWSDLNPGADGSIVLSMDPEATSPSNIAYLSAMRLVASGGTIDSTPPSLMATNPPDNASGVAVGVNLVLDFDEAIQKGTGNVTIKLAADGSVVETIDVTTSGVTASGNQLTVNPSTTLASSTGYYVEISSGAIEDLAGNAFAGISGSTAWNFTTSTPITGFVAYHDVAGSGHNPPANTSWQTTANTTTDLVRFADGVDTGIDLTTSGVDSLDDRSSGETQPPDADTPAGVLFLGSGLDLNDGTLVKQGGAMTFSFSGLDPGVLYDLALYGDRSTSADGAETFSLVGADAAVNLSTGINSGLSTDWDTRQNGGSGNPGHVARWTNINSGSDGSVEVTITNADLNLAYISGVRIGPAVPDTTGPFLASTIPANGFSQAPPGDSLIALFDEPISLGTGSITIRRTADDSVVEFFDVATSSRLITGYASITIDPGSDLAPNSGYYVEIGSDAIDDLFGNSFDGLSGSTGWSFTTSTPPDPSLTGVPIAGGTSPSAAFDAWIAQFEHVGTHIGPYHNPDGSRFNSFAEFAFAGDPLNVLDEGPINGDLHEVGGQEVLTLTVPVRDGALFSGAPVLLSDPIDGISYGIEASRDLSLWDVAVSEVTGPDAATIQAPLPALSPGWTYRTFRVPGSTATEPRMFFRAFADDVPTRIQQARDSSVIASYALGKVKRWLNEVAIPKINSNDLYVAHNGGSARYSSWWNYDDTAADCYPFLFWAAFYTDIDKINTTDGPVHDVLVAEQLHCNLNSTPGSPFGRVPTAVNPDTLVKEISSYTNTMFAASEYVKDGLIPIVEVMGTGNPWFDRMQGIIDDMWANAQVNTPYGLVPTTGTEANGEQLQALARLYTMTGDPKYLDWGERLADQYLLSGTFVPSSLRDHGCEIVGGLGLFYAVESVHRPAKAATWLPGLRYMLDEILDRGTNPDGIMYNSIGGGGLSDGWGYNYPAFLCHDLAVSPPRYSLGLQQTLRNLAKPIYATAWGSNIDENADSIEGGLYQINRFQIPEAIAWADQEMANHVTKTQNPDVNTTSLWGTYKLESNGVRTVLQHAMMHTRGLIARPWELDLELGASQTADGVVVTMSSTSGWTGVLEVDKPRHQVLMGMSKDWPRMNTMPEWFVAEPNETYVVENLNTGTTATYTGAQLHAGLPVTLSPGVETLLWIRK